MLYILATQEDLADELYPQVDDDRVMNRLVEEVLPQTFGGAPTDYQLVETEENGISRIQIIASPKLGPLDENVVVERVITTLNQYPGGTVMTQHWRQGDTLKLVRREPYQTASAKILPLHLQRLTVAT